MKNFWLSRRRKKIFTKRINQINHIIQGAVDHKLKARLGGKVGWRTKKGTKTQP